MLIKTNLYLIILIVVLICLNACAFNQKQTALLKPDSKTLSNNSSNTKFKDGINAFEKGRLKIAITFFDIAAAEFKQKEDLFGQCDSLLRAAHASLSLGYTDQAVKYLHEAEKLTPKINAPKLLGRIIAFKGNLLHVTGASKAAKENLRSAICIANKHDYPELSAKAYNDLGNLLSSLQQYDQALTAYRESAFFASKIGDKLLTAIAQTNAAMILITMGDLELNFRQKNIIGINSMEKAFARGKIRGTVLYANPSQDNTVTNNSYKAKKLFHRAVSMLDKARVDLMSVANSQHRITAHINIGLAYKDLADRDLQNAQQHRQTSFEEFFLALDASEAFQNDRLTSYITGNIGSLHKEDGKLDKALEQTEKAIYLARKAGVPESLYRWQWQYAQIRFLQKQIRQAILAFEEAIMTLESIRSEFTNCYGQSGSELRKTADALYLAYVDVLLKVVDEFEPDEQQKILKRARETVEKRKVFELREYFNDDCLGVDIAESTNVDELIETAVVIYPIILPDRLEIIATFPSGKKQSEQAKNKSDYKIKHYVTRIDSTSVSQMADSLCRALKAKDSQWEEYMPQLKKFHDWLISPLKPQLISTAADTLVFIPDGVLRNIPMGALNDGHRYLIESYAVAVTPGLVLTNPKPLSTEKMNILAVGISQAFSKLPSLPGVAEELLAIKNLYPVRVLMDRQFSLTNFERTLKDDTYNVVHIASHGEFKEPVDDSFIQAYDGHLTFNDLAGFVGLYRFRDHPLELLTLSACETAAGNDTAALGMAGIAVKIGARSALATLWAVDDQAAARLVVEFYRQLGQDAVSKATALQRAQQKLFKDPNYSHPGYWSPFILINSWL